MNYLGLDYGLSHIGVAFSSGSIATPLLTLSPPKSLTFLSQIIDKYQIDALVVGMPEGSVAEPARQFARSLETLGKPVHMADETLSSRQAVDSLLHTTPARRQANEHAAAAAIILQSWLDSHTQTL